MSIEQLSKNNHKQKFFSQFIKNSSFTVPAYGNVISWYFFWISFACIRISNDAYTDSNSMVKLAGDWRLDIGHSLLGQIWESKVDFYTVQTLLSLLRPFSEFRKNFWFSKNFCLLLYYWISKIGIWTFVIRADIQL